MASSAPDGFTPVTRKNKNRPKTNASGASLALQTAANAVNTASKRVSRSLTRSTTPARSVSGDTGATPRPQPRYEVGDARRGINFTQLAELANEWNKLHSKSDHVDFPTVRDMTAGQFANFVKELEEDKRRDHNRARGEHFDKVTTQLANMTQKFTVNANMFTYDGEFDAMMYARTQNAYYKFAHEYFIHQDVTLGQHMSFLGISMDAPGASVYKHSIHTTVVSERITFGATVDGSTRTGPVTRLHHMHLCIPSTSVNFPTGYNTDYDVESYGYAYDPASILGAGGVEFTRSAIGADETTAIDGPAFGRYLRSVTTLPKDIASAFDECKAIFAQETTGTNVKFTLLQLRFQTIIRSFEGILDKLTPDQQAAVRPIIDNARAELDASINETKLAAARREQLKHEKQAAANSDIGLASTALPTTSASYAGAVAKSSLNPNASSFDAAAARASAQAAANAKKKADADAAAARTVAETRAAIAAAGGTDTPKDLSEPYATFTEAQRAANEAAVQMVIADAAKYPSYNDLILKLADPNDASGVKLAKRVRFTYVYRHMDDATTFYHATSSFVSPAIVVVNGRIGVVDADETIAKRKEAYDKFLELTSTTSAS